MEIDQINRRILQELERNGRISNSDLSEKVGLSASACLRRVQELERQDIIQGYRAVINRRAMGVGVVVYVTVGLSGHSTQDQKSFEKIVERAPEVRESHVVAGSFEYILRVEVPDLDAYKHFHNEVLGTAPKVNSIVSYIVMETPIDLRS